MKNPFNFINRISKTFVALLITLGSLTFLAQFAAAQEKNIKNIVIVHGAFADGSGWRGVHDILVQKGYHVTVVQNPLTGLKDDIEATKRILDKQDGPTILVGHSWGGVVITEAGLHEKVAALVYVAAYQPDKGENTIKWASSLPSAPEFGILPPDDKGFVYYAKDKFHAGFAADLSKAETDFLFDSQQPIYAESFSTPVADAAWRTKPSYGIVATEDKSINPDIQRNMYKRSNTKITEVKGSHVIFASNPDAVARVIISASQNK
ncbi:alpha/beta hydrolase [Pedobacter sp.]|uniref:alpha/beta hydrolase n=1 Tax=Pedobacter sp. TaxID=1411316 RepID=UPI003BAB59A8